MTPQSETDMSDLRPRMVSAEHQLTDHHHRLTKMEEWRHKADIADARMEERFKGVENKLNKIDSNLSRLMWIFIAGICAGVVTFLLNGGFKVP